MARGVMPATSDQHELGDLTRIVDRSHRTPKRSATIKHALGDGRGHYELLETRNPGPIDGDLLQHGQHVVVVDRTPRRPCVAQSARKLLAMGSAQFVQLPNDRVQVRARDAQVRVRRPGTA
jgi:hypothetical protein